MSRFLLILSILWGIDPARWAGFFINLTDGNGSLGVPEGCRIDSISDIGCAKEVENGYWRNRDDF